MLIVNWCKTSFRMNDVAKMFRTLFMTQAAAASPFDHLSKISNYNRFHRLPRVASSSTNVHRAFVPYTDFLHTFVIPIVNRVFGLSSVHITLCTVLFLNFFPLAERQVARLFLMMIIWISHYGCSNQSFSYSQFIKNVTPIHLLCLLTHIYSCVGCSRTVFLEAFSS